MSLCRNMVNDFMFAWGDREPVTGEPLYDKRDLAFGAQYARGYAAEGETHDLISGFELKPFAEWWERKLKASGAACGVPSRHCYRRLEGGKHHGGNRRLEREGTLA